MKAECLPNDTNVQGTDIGLSILTLYMWELGGRTGRVTVVCYTQTEGEGQVDSLSDPDLSHACTCPISDLYKLSTDHK